jgi:hypothetical protein
MEPSVGAVELALEGPTYCLERPPPLKEQNTVTDTGCKESPVIEGLPSLPLSEAFAQRLRTASWQRELQELVDQDCPKPVERLYRITVAPQSPSDLDKDPALQMAYSFDAMDSLSKLCVYFSALV